MKHLSKLLAVLWMAGSLIACSKDEVPEPNRTPLDPNGNIQFPDAKFAAYMVENFDTDGDGGISPAEAAAITEIDCRGMEIESLAGIEYCTELTYLNCGDNYKNGYINKLTSLDVSNNTKLTYLCCSYNQLTSLDVSKNTELTLLYCQYQFSQNQLTTLDVSKNTKLTWLYCYRNPLTTLNVSNNTELTNLCCPSCELTALDVSKNTKLTDLDCGYIWSSVRNERNHLKTLDVSKNTKLRYLRCYDNQLTTLDVSKTMLNNGIYSTSLECSMESLQTLYLKTGWQLKGINEERDERYIHPNTQIEYKD